MRKRWIIISVAAGLLALAITGGAIFAHGPGGRGGHANDADYGRMAELLDVEESQVREAYRQLRRGNQDDAVQLRLDRLVESEAMELEQADAIMEWYQDRPDDIPPGVLGKRGGKRGFQGRRHGGQMRPGALHPSYTAPATTQ